MPPIPKQTLIDRGPGYQHHMQQEPGLSHEDAELIAQHVVAKLLHAATNEDNVKMVSTALGREFDLILGRGLRKIGFAFLVFLMGVASIKFDFFAKFLKGP